MIAVKLDDARFGAGPGTVIAHIASVAAYVRMVTDRDGAVDPLMRLWGGDMPIGSRVQLEGVAGGSRLVKQAGLKPGKKEPHMTEKNAKYNVLKNPSQRRNTRTESAVKRLLRVEAKLKALYAKRDEAFEAVRDAFNAEERHALARGASIQTTVVVDGKRYQLVDNFATSNRVYRAHGINRFELKEVK